MCSSDLNQSYNVGASVQPMDAVTIGMSYGKEKFSSFQNSRNANPIGSDYGSWTDPNRTWNLSNDEHVNNFLAYLDLANAIKHTDIRLSYDYSDSDQAFIHSGPRIVELTTNTALTAGDAKPCAAGLTSCFQALPNVTNTWRQLSADFQYHWSKQVGFALGYRYEKFDVSDYATIDLPGQPGVPRIDYLGEINTGYGVHRETISI